MDEVLDQFETTGIHQGSEFASLYKNWGKLDNQESRRKELLDIQKSDRNAKIDKLRGILELATFEAKEIVHGRSRYRPNVYVAGFTNVPDTYKNVLMMSEWMIEKPEDIHENWYVIPCPKATRTLVIANKGTTKCYSKYGHFYMECRTALPGGNTSDPQYRSKCCVLDCFYYEKNKVMYVLDLLAWNSQPMTDGETEFRDYWLKTHLSEIPELTSINRTNKIIFTVLPKVDCSEQSLNGFMMTYPHFQDFFPQLDGLLFYHKKVNYISGQTPLVGWLYPYMVPEVLGEDVKLNVAYLLEKPQQYTNQADFIKHFESMTSKKFRISKKNQFSANPMDTWVNEDSENSQNNSMNTGGESLDTETSETESINAMAMEAENPLENIDEPSEMERIV